MILNKNIKEIAEDLFEASKEYVIGYCVSQDLPMIKDIALEFRRRIEQLEEFKNENKSVAEIVSIVLEG